MSKRKYSQGDWVIIKYGEYAGNRGMIAAFSDQGSYVVIPYNDEGEPEGTLKLLARAMEPIPPLLISEVNLKRICRAELLYSDFESEVFPAFNIAAEKDYEITAWDIREAFLNIKRKRNPLDIFKEWFWLILNVFYNDLHIEERYDEKFFSDAPENERELFSVVYGLTEKLYWRLEERFGQKEEIEKYIIKFKKPLDWEIKKDAQIEEIGFLAVCEDILSRVNVYWYNMSLPKEYWDYSDSQKKHIISSYSGPEDLKEATPEALELFKKFVNDLSEKGDPQALKILAWGHYEGNEVYEQNWELAEHYLLKLYEKTGDPYAANSLGYIYYYGRVNNHVPEYEKAYRYFSFGAISGIDESIYKCADLLIAGRGVVKNIDVGLNMLVDGYRETMDEFCEGHFENKLADYAVRMGDACRNNLIYAMNLRDAYKFYLEAKFAIRKRRETDEGYGDDVVERRIDREIERIIEEMNLDINANTVTTDFPLYINQIFDDKYPIMVTLDMAKNGKKGTLKLARYRAGSELVKQGIIPEDEEIARYMTPPPILVAYPELSYTELVTEITYTIENVTVAQKKEKGKSFQADGFRKNDKTTALEFFMGGNLVAAIDAQWYTITVEKDRGKK